MFHVMELPLHLGSYGYSFPRMGITGAAIAVVTRLAIDLALVLWACERFGYSPSGAIHRIGVTKSLAGLVFIAGVLLAASYVQSSLLHRVVRRVSQSYASTSPNGIGPWISATGNSQLIVHQLPLTKSLSIPYTRPCAMIHSAKSPEAD